MWAIQHGRGGHRYTICSLLNVASPLCRVVFLIGRHHRGFHHIGVTTTRFRGINAPFLGCFFHWFVRVVGFQRYYRHMYTVVETSGRQLHFVVKGATWPRISSRLIGVAIGLHPRQHVFGVISKSIGAILSMGGRAHPPYPRVEVMVYPRRCVGRAVQFRHHSGGSTRSVLFFRS